MNNFYIYIHRRASDNLPFYVGKGKNERAWWPHGRSQFWNNVKNKHGLVVEIVFDELSEEDAFQCEKDTILEFRYFGYPLVNLTDGGDGSCGWKPSEENRRRMSEAQKTSPRAAETRKRTADKKLGILLSAEHRRRISEGLKGKAKSPAHRNATGKAKRCTDQYVFQNITTHAVFIGTRHEFEFHSELSRIQVSLLFGQRQARISKGWRLLSPPNNLQIIN